MAALKTYRARVRKEDETDFAGVSKKYAAASIEDARARAENDGFVVLSIKEVRANDPYAPSMSVQSSSLIATYALAGLAALFLSLALPQHDPEWIPMLFVAAMLAYAFAIGLGNFAGNIAIRATLKTEESHAAHDNHLLWYAFRLIPFSVIFISHITIVLALRLNS